MGEQISIAIGDDQFGAYLAKPTTALRGGVIVIQEIFGVNDDIKATADWLADEGYLALAPDLFWRQERHISLSAANDADVQKAFSLMIGYDDDLGIRDIQASIDYLRDQGCPKIGTIGFCLGGRMVYLSACRTDADAHASYYGVGIQDMLDEARDITAPTLIHIAGADEFVPPEAQAAIAEGLAAHNQVEVHIYQGKDHAFARHNGMHYDAAATKLAHERTLTLFSEALT